MNRRPVTLAAWSGVVFCGVLLAACADEPPLPADGGLDGVVDAETDTPGLADGPADVEPDVELADAQAPDTAPDAPVAYPRPVYGLLSETGLYSAMAGKTISADLVPFAPTHVLWSDAAKKRRWIRLPPGTRVDTADMDHWQFPIGTKLFKEFASPDGVLLETRLIERYGPGSEDYWMGAFVWNAEQTEAAFAVDGQRDINGTQHDAPAQRLCGSCHRGDAGRVLGFSAVQLSRPPRAESDVTLQRLSVTGQLTHPPAAGTDFPVPGDADTAAALGYLHANCGHCHNLSGPSWPDTQMVLRLRVGERDAAQSELWKTVVGGKLQSWRNPAFTLRVVPHEPEQSGLVARMARRGSRDQMPPLATEIVDPTGVELVTRWISSLPTAGN